MFGIGEFFVIINLFQTVVFAVGIFVLKSFVEGKFCFFFIVKMSYDSRVIDEIEVF